MTQDVMPRHTEYMRVDEMREALENPKGHAEERIRGSIERWGLIDQAVLDERTGRLVHGHGRLHQVMDLMDEGQAPPDGIVLDDEGRWLWPVTRGWRSNSDQEAHIAAVTLNRLTEVGGWADLEVLAHILDQANELDPALLELSGYAATDLDTLHAIVEQATAGPSEDDEAVLARTDQAAWPRISCQVPPDVYARWQAVPGADDGDRVMALLRCWERRDSDDGGG